MEKIIQVENLKKNYGPVEAVRGISFYVEKGKLFSFLGPNGAGKSTTIDVLCTLQKHDGGQASIAGYDTISHAGDIRRRIGVVFQDHVLDGLLTVQENLTLRAGLYTQDKRRMQRALDMAVGATELGECLHRRYGKLSGGQRRRADIARALIHTPDILFLDEPTTGLDPQTRQSIWATIRKLQQEQGMTIFLTTHYMEEAAASDYVIVIDHGQIAAKGTPTELKTTYASDTLRLFASDIGGLQSALQGQDYTISGQEMAVKISDTMASLALLERCRPYISGFEVLQGTMDDAFMGITGKELRQ